MNISSSPTIDLSKISFPISIDSAAIHTSEAIGRFKQGSEDKKNPERQVFDALIVTPLNDPLLMEQPSSHQLELICSSWQLAGLPFPLKGAPLNDAQAEMYQQAFLSYTYETNWKIEIITVEWQIYHECCMRLVLDEHQTILKEKISNGRINPSSPETLRRLGKDGWHPNNLLLESEFLILCQHLEIDAFRNSCKNESIIIEREINLEQVVLLRESEIDLALYDLFASEGGEISKTGLILTRGGHIKRYVQAFNKDPRTIKKMLSKGKGKRVKANALNKTVLS